MSRKPNPELIDDENPEWTAEEVAGAMRFSGLPTTLQAKLRGRPKAAVVKQRLTIRVDADVLAQWRASGKGWQTRAAELLRRGMPG